MLNMKPAVGQVFLAWSLQAQETAKRDCPDQQEADFFFFLTKSWGQNEHNSYLERLRHHYNLRRAGADISFSLANECCPLCCQTITHKTEILKVIFVNIFAFIIPSALWDCDQKVAYMAQKPMLKLLSNMYTLFIGLYMLRSKAGCFPVFPLLMLS